MIPLDSEFIVIQCVSDIIYVCLCVRVCAYSDVTQHCRHERCHCCHCAESVVYRHVCHYLRAACCGSLRQIPYARIVFIFVVTIGAHLLILFVCQTTTAECREGLIAARALFAIMRHVVAEDAEIRMHAGKALASVCGGMRYRVSLIHFAFVRLCLYFTLLYACCLRYHSGARCDCTRTVAVASVVCTHHLTECTDGRRSGTCRTGP